MNLDFRSTYTHVAVVCGIETVGCLLFVYAKPLAVLFNSCALLALVKLVTDESATSIMLPVKRLSLMVVVTWTGWHLWSAAMPVYDIPLPVRLVHGQAMLAIGVYAARKENASFHAMNNRAFAIVAAVVVLGVLPMNPAYGWRPEIVVLQSTLHAVNVFLLFFLRMKRELVNTTIAIFTYAFWILAAYAPVAICVSAVLAVVTGAQLYQLIHSPQQLQQQRDVEAQRDVATASMVNAKPKPRAIALPVQPKNVQNVIIRAVAKPVAAATTADDFARLIAQQEPAPRTVVKLDNSDMSADD